MNRVVYIYRGILTSGGCSKIIEDLIDALNTKGGFDIYLVTHRNSNFSIKNCTRISIPRDPFWMKQASVELSKHVASANNPALISFLDHDSNDFFSFCSSFLDHKIRWINFNTNHPKIISNWFKRMNGGVDITEEDLYNAVDVIRLENENFHKYMPINVQDKCVDFLNTVRNPNSKDLLFNNKLNLLSVNGLREGRKSILPLIKELNILIDKNIDFKLRVLGDQDPLTMLNFEDYISNNPRVSKYLEILPSVNNIHDYYESSTLAVTTATYEGTSNSVLESFVHNLPVLCLDSALGLNETVDHEINGLQCSSPKAMASSILDLYEDKSKLKKLQLGCELIKEKILNPKLGIDKYFNALDCDPNHSPAFREKLNSYSKAFLDAPHFYRQRLEALVIYTDLDKPYLKIISEALKSKAAEESKKVFFICKYSKKTDLDSFLRFLEKYEKTEILYKYTSAPESVSEIFSCNNGVEALVSLCSLEVIKTRLNDLFEVVAFFDSQCGRIAFLNQYENNLRSLSSWKRRDEWVWLIGASEESLNSCVFNYSPVHRFNFKDLTNFLKNNQNSPRGLVGADGKIINLKSLPIEIMKKIRKLY